MASINLHHNRKVSQPEVCVKHLDHNDPFTVVTIRFGDDEVSFFLLSREAAMALYLSLGNAIQAADEKDTAGPSAAPVDDDDVFEINGPPPGDDDDEPQPYNTTRGTRVERKQG